MITGALISLAGSFVTSFFNARSQREQRLSEERKHLRETVINAAIENWKESARQLGTNAGTLHMLPLDVFIIHMLKLADLLTDGDLSENNVIDKLKKIDLITNKASDHILKKGVPTLNNT